MADDGSARRSVGSQTLLALAAAAVLPAMLSFAQGSLTSFFRDWAEDCVIVIDRDPAWRLFNRSATRSFTVFVTGDAPAELPLIFEVEAAPGQDFRLQAVALEPRANAQARRVRLIDENQQCSVIETSTELCSADTLSPVDISTGGPCATGSNCAVDHLEVTIAPLIPSTEYRFLAAGIDAAAASAITMRVDHAVYAGREGSLENTVLDCVVEQRNLLNGYSMLNRYLRFAVMLGVILLLAYLVRAWSRPGAPS